MPPRVTTTREAKRLAKQQKPLQPTAAQIRTAERFEEQQRLRQKEDQRRKSKDKQAAKKLRDEETQRQYNEEQLRKGNITISQTWGRRNASQPHLGKFFNSAFSQRVQQRTEEDIDVQDTHEAPIPREGADAVTQMQNHTQNLSPMKSDAPQTEHHKNISIDHEHFFHTGSIEAQICPSEAMSSRKTPPSLSPTDARKRQCLARPDCALSWEKPGLCVKVSNISRFPQTEAEPFPTSARSSSAHTKMIERNGQPPQSRPALAEMSVGDLNVRANTRPNPETSIIEELSNMSEQISAPASCLKVNDDLLLDLCTQDFFNELAEGEDDVVAEKENVSPTARSLPLGISQTPKNNVQQSNLRSQLTTCAENDKEPNLTQYFESDDDFADVDPDVLTGSGGGSQRFVVEAITTCITDQTSLEQQDTHQQEKKDPHWNSRRTCSVTMVDDENKNLHKQAENPDPSQAPACVSFAMDSFDDYDFMLALGEQEAPRALRAQQAARQNLASQAQGQEQELQYSETNYDTEALSDEDIALCLEQLENSDGEGKKNEEQKKNIQPDNNDDRNASTNYCSRPRRILPWKKDQHRQQDQYQDQSHDQHHCSSSTSSRIDEILV